LGGDALAGPSTGGHAQHPGHAALPARHKAQLGGLRADLIHGESGEIAEHDLHDGSHPDQGGSGTRSDDGVFADGGVAHSRRTELVEERAGDAKCAAVFGNVLSHQKDPLIAQHFFPQRLANRLLVGQFPGRYTWRDLPD
jgi:hypothetical protein